MAADFPRPKVDDIVLYELPVASRHTATATRFSIDIASRSRVFIFSVVPRSNLTMKLNVFRDTRNCWAQYGSRWYTSSWSTDWNQNWGLGSIDSCSRHALGMVSSCDICSSAITMVAVSIAIACVLGRLAIWIILRKTRILLRRFLAWKMLYSRINNRCLQSAVVKIIRCDLPLLYEWT